MTPTISCIITVFNCEAYLGEALDSAFAQTRPPDEVIVVDDGSTDGTPAVAQGYGERVRYVRQPNRGPAGGRNRGIAMASGELIAFLDADDIWLPGKLARQVRHFAERPDLQASVTQLRNFWTEELRAEAEAMRDHALAAEALPGFVPQTLVARREVFGSVGLFDEALLIGEDTDWFLRASDLRIALEMVPEVLVLRRFHANNLTRTATVAQSKLPDIVWRSLQRRRASERPDTSSVSSPINNGTSGEAIS